MVQHNTNQSMWYTILTKEKTKTTWLSRQMQKKHLIKLNIWTSLVAQWLRIRLPMHRTQVRSLVQEDPTCCGATKPVRHNYWSPRTVEPACHKYWAHTLQLLKPVHSRVHVPQLLSLRAATTEARTPRAHALQQEKPLQWKDCTAMKNSPCSLQLEKALVQQRRPDAAKK